MFLCLSSLAARSKKCDVLALCLPSITCLGFCFKYIGNTIDGELPWWPYSSNQAMSSVSGTAQPGRCNSRVLGHQAKTLAGSYKLTSLAKSHSQATEWLVGFSESASIWRMEAGEE